MKNFINVFCACFILSSAALVGCSQDEDVMSALDAQADLSVNANANANKANNAAVTKFYTADLASLNESGVSGKAYLELNGNDLLVRIEAEGLEANELHPQHIHGFAENKGNATCPPASADSNGDGFISVGEGLPFYGGILQPLVNDVNEPLSFPIADSDGTVIFEKTYTVDASVTPLQNRVIVLHGKTVEGFVTAEGETIDGYQLTLPVACGQITPDQGSEGNGR